MLKPQAPMFLWNTWDGRGSQPGCPPPRGVSRQFRLQICCQYAPARQYWTSHRLSSQPQRRMNPGRTPERALWGRWITHPLRRGKLRTKQLKSAAAPQSSPLGSTYPWRMDRRDK